MTHEMILREIYFNKIKSGEKIYEIRLNDEKRQLIDVGDVVIFRKDTNANEVIQTIVEDLIYFTSFKEMASTLPSKKIGFENDQINKIEEIYHQFYSSTDEQKYGVLAIKIKIL